jgi:putative endonuclease
VSTWSKGREGESAAARFLCERGYTIVSRNFRTRRGEIDIVAEKDSRIVFVEVKSWDCLDSEDLEYSIDRRKQQRIVATSRAFLHTHPEYQRSRVGFDVILVSPKTTRVVHYESAFTS